MEGKKKKNEQEILKLAKEAKFYLINVLTSYVSGEFIETQDSDKVKEDIKKLEVDKDAPLWVYVKKMPKGSDRDKLFQVLLDIDNLYHFMSVMPPKKVPVKESYVNIKDDIVSKEDKEYAEKYKSSS